MASTDDEIADQQAQKPPPPWLDEQFYEEIFVSQHRLAPGKFKVKINSVTPTGGAGENYTSSLYRANVDAVCDDGSIHSLRVIIKAPMVMPDMARFKVFEREKHMYEQMLPAMERLWAEAGETIRFGPRCWKTVEGDTEILVLGDLEAEGYSVANRQQGVGLEHFHVLFEKFAKFHAAGAVIYRKNGSPSPLYDECLTISPEEITSMEQYVDLIKPVFFGILSNTPDDERYKSKLEKSMENSFEKLNIALKFDDSKFVTLCHGDMWTNNHMYSYHPSGAPKDALLIDFQGPYFGSPVTDLFNYIVSSTNVELKSTKFDELVQYYHTQLAAALKKLEYPDPIPSLRDIHIELLKGGYFGMQCLFGLLPSAVADKNENANMEAFYGDSEENKKFRYDLFNNPLFYQHLKPLLKLFDARGLLDYE